MLRMFLASFWKMMFLDFYQRSCGGLFAFAFAFFF